MNKLLASGMSKFWRVVLGIMIITVVSITSNSASAIAASSWDNETESYSGKQEMIVYRSPSCSCCGDWLDHVKKHGFKIKQDVKTDEMEAIKQKYNLPSELASCHTAIIDGYVMEGHVPADDIKRLLKQKPQLAGLAVPAMPVGTPGMEIGNTKQPFSVIAFNKKGELQVFNSYESY
ncbi:DUF411 domain-containing protein [Nostoc cycadae]|uniref:Metal-binding protein n=1 Tax=Nostoc cycadae WK-1 TaxID=1861711 RepID=A0A2H6LQB3_9NOSO|nr:DUF411 domain-containing protein [Nostoc cycadae]GBE95346.1 metal-binding protein [Nostoc cycadae WK-1]